MGRAAAITKPTSRRGKLVSSHRVGGVIPLLFGRLQLSLFVIVSVIVPLEICNCLCFSLGTGRMDEVVPVQDTLGAVSAISSGFPSADLGQLVSSHMTCT